MAASLTRRAGNATFAPSDGSRTITVHDSQPREADADPAADDDAGPSAAPGTADIVGTLRLRGAPRERRGRRVAWSEEVVDNEGMGKKKSKICCIYHKPREFGESSSEDSSSSDDDSDSSNDDGRARPSNLNAGLRPRRHHHHHHVHGNGDGTRDRDNGAEVHELESDHEPNAYERQPKKGKGKAK